jgi:hypothetical protein
MTLYTIGRKDINANATTYAEEYYSKCRRGDAVNIALMFEVIVSSV